MSKLEEKEIKLTNLLNKLDSATVAFSGGIDSTLILKMALDVLGKDKVTAVVANSELFTDEEFDKAISLAKDLGANVKTVTLDYLSDEHIKQNTPDSWYYAKKMFYNRLNNLSLAENNQVVLDGMIKDDENDYRPGLKARDESGALSLLQQADFYKSDVRDLSQKLSLNNWNKVASCSVSSRFPYGTILNHDNISQVMLSEKYLRGLGFPIVRVRYHNNIARIEIPSDRIEDFLPFDNMVSHKLQELGFQYVTLDLSGFRSGRMNDDLTQKQISAFA
ncbi:ATP-dependent sacrificial sulfur transferase LarE [Apilactobacillus micheneri]|uniref:ATP-dependent sacrificial sulfur transferase LarE n=1 Tax=Apilactobacillus micheneri TaxID=1899430 RepID=A0ABY2YZP4_9LACO|nr:ATP-dependent sacrificial sulfur transferase LarE [Apilactobacillus micheneri]TPR26362.1 ATP-dependent sacrificial sulfur transferase LarE [Apilactobacillus micheneri]TPR27116.1 ATP-dependent sacrificial sulfur transferase LarE [Apilactobacillus micheneri]TPR27364.1 ATP-dependent sacrificial sulfur transferase LarE [Apilactobacillus micheneri]TPR31879.1 ATP-dependent sacrificial sulfur transferase LarE [Apilactobacillus micheneri]TPR32283.1 ATP-dependent sacrificial sulfur transferase LarE 